MTVDAGGIGSGALRPGTATDGAAIWGPRAGLLGAALFGGATVAAAVAYGGPGGAIYSPLNQWVSELGEVGASSLGTAFNAGLVAGGIGFAGFMAAFARARGSAVAVAAGVLGVVSGVLGALVGVFPLGGSELHRPVAIGFFVIGAVALALGALDIARRPGPAFPRWLATLGWGVVAAFAAFIVATLARGSAHVVEPRPAFLFEPASEWLAVGGILAWTAAASWTWMRDRRSA